VRHDTELAALEAERLERRQLADDGGDRAAYTRTVMRRRTAVAPPGGDAAAPLACALALPPHARAGTHLNALPRKKRMRSEMSAQKESGRSERLPT